DAPIEEQNDDHVEDPNDHGIQREYYCCNDPQEICRTGQYTLALSRKVISDHFGRNKACTRQIKSWPLMCRKHYQRATYNNKVWQLRKLELIVEQFDAIESQIPGTKYTVGLKKSEDERLNTFSRKLAMGKTEAEAESAVAPGASKSFEAPIKLLRELEKGLGKNKTIEEVKETVDTIEHMVHLDDTAKVPSIEFLPQIGKDGQPFTYGAPVPKARKSTKKTGSRVSKKGGIQK
ncbi:hypothetical protein CC80DRAFT_388491, partial [Byssothecium circinans]